MTSPSATRWRTSSVYWPKNPADLTEDRPVFAVAGRMMAINKFGKAGFHPFS